MRIVIAGATGFVGRRLVNALHAEGHSLVALTRHTETAFEALGGRARSVRWTGTTSSDTPLQGWIQEVDAADAVVNLAGEPVVGRWSPAKKEAIRNSRIDSTRALARALLQASARQRVYVEASAVGYYGSSTEPVDEASRPGDGFLARLCVDREREAASIDSSSTRLVLARLGVVLGREGGALGQMLPVFRAGLGGPIGRGNQWMSWISADDTVGLLTRALTDPAIRGPLNVVAPEPCTNATFAATLGRALGRPALVHVPAFALRLALGEGADVVLEGQRVMPARAAALGFAFRHPTLGEALVASLAPPPLPAI